MSNEPVTAKKGMGCGAWLGMGCLVVIVLCVSLLAIAYYGAKALVNKCTDTAPMELAKISVSSADVQRVVLKVQEFGDALKAGTAVQPLILSAQDLNCLVSDINESGEAGIRLAIENNKLKGQVSLPLEKMMPALKGRYLNGAALFSVSLADGRLLVFMDDLEVKGKKLPDAFMRDLRASNMAEDANKDPEFQDKIRFIESIRIEDNNVVIMPKTTTIEMSK
jgi:hypothetical protein